MSRFLWSSTQTGLFLCGAYLLPILPSAISPIAAQTIDPANTVRASPRPASLTQPKRDRGWNSQTEAVTRSTRERISQTAPTPIQENLTSQIEPIEPAARVTSVSQLSDVKQTDWSFLALQSLIEKYGAISGYPNHEFRGDRTMTRAEFAAGLNLASDRISAIAAAGLADKVSQSDLEILHKLQSDFSAELATLRGRVDSLESRTAIVENQQFAPITKLRGTVMFVLGDTFGEPAPRGSNTFLQSYASFMLQTSFTGKDLLNLRITATNTPNLIGATGSYTSNLFFDAVTSPNSIRLDRLAYQFPIGDRATVWLAASTLQPYDWIPVVNPLVRLGAYPNSRFALWNSASNRLGFLASGLGAAYRFNENLQIHAGYFGNTDQASIPTGGNGIFNGNYAAVAQLTYTASREFEAAFTYAHKYFTVNTVNLQGFVGSFNSLNPFGQNATASDSFGVEFGWKLSPKVSLGGWFGYAIANQLSGGNNSATILNGALNLALIDLFQEGNVGGLIIGVPPKLSSNTYIDPATKVLRQDLNTSLHFEVFYNYKLTKNITLTPDLFVVTTPDGNRDPIWVGTLRTTFSF